MKKAQIAQLKKIQELLAVDKLNSPAWIELKCIQASEIIDQMLEEDATKKEVKG